MNLKNILFYSMIVIIVGLSIYLLIFTQTKSYECLSSPLQFGVKQYTSSIGDFSCACTSPMAKQTLLVTKDNITTQFNYLSITP